MKQKGIETIGTVLVFLGLLACLAMTWLSTQPALLERMNNILGW